MEMSFPTRAEAASDRRTIWAVRCGLALLLGGLALYGAWSAPDLAARWGASAGGLALLAGWTGLAFAILRGSRSRTAWGFVALAGVALRVGSAVLASGRVSPGDSQLYLELARHLLAGNGLVVREPYIGLAVRGFYPPLYPLLLAGWGAVAGFGTVSLLILSTLIDLAAAGLIVALGRRLGRVDAGRAAATLYLIWPSAVLSAPLAQKEGLAALCVLALAIGWHRAVSEPATRAWRRAVGIGVPAAALALTQPGQAPLALLFGLALMPLFGWRPVLGVGWRAALVAALGMTPWWLRNALIFDRFVPLTTASGVSLWIGSSASATGGWEPSPRAAPGADEIGYAAGLGRIAADWAIGHPLATVRLYATKFVRGIALGQSGIARLAAMRPSLGYQSAAALLPLAHGAQVLLLGTAAWAALRQRQAEATLAFAAAGLAQLLLFALPFEFAERHREFLTPLLLLLVAQVAVRTATSPSQTAPRSTPT